MGARISLDREGMLDLILDKGFLGELGGILPPA